MPFPIKQEVYKSTTLGEIPLSFTGRRLLANLRDAEDEAIATGDRETNHEALSVARAKIAKYMSNMEKAQNKQENTRKKK